MRKLNRREFGLVVVGGVAALAETVASQGVPPIAINISKNDAEAAGKRHPGNVDSALADMDKLKAGTAQAAGVAGVVGAVVPGAGQVGKFSGAAGAAAGLGKRFGLGGGGDKRGADWFVQEQVAQALAGAAGAPVVLVYGDAAKAAALKGVQGVPANTVFLYVDPAAPGNKDFKDHFAGKGDRIVVWPPGAAADKPVAVLNSIEAATGQLAAKLSGAAPAVQPATPAR